MGDRIVCFCANYLQGTEREWAPQNLFGYAKDVIIKKLFHPDVSRVLIVVLFATPFEGLATRSVHILEGAAGSRSDVCRSNRANPSEALSAIEWFRLFR